jgi:DNA-binding transcriptional MerR regulator
MFTIKEVSEMMNVSEHTLRFWAKSGFFPFVTRNKNNVRMFSDRDLSWVYIVKCLRSTGADNKAIKRYLDLCVIGDSTIEERYEIIKSTRAKAEVQMRELLKQMEVLDKKEEYYENMMANNGNDKCNPMNLRDDLNKFLETHMAKK